MRYTRAFGAALIVLTAALSGCTSSSESSAIEPSSSQPSASASADSTDQPDGALVTDPELLFATWRATELYGRAVDPTLRVGGRHLNVSFAKSEGKDPSWSSTDLCNSIGGHYTVGHAGAFETRSQWSTAMACLPGSPVGESNIKALTDADQAWLDPADGAPAQLTLTDDGEPIAVYVRR